MKIPRECPAGSVVRGREDERSHREIAIAMFHRPSLAESMTHGDRLPDSRTTTDRIFVSYPMKETEAEKAKRVKAGLPAPRLEFVVGTVKK